jgi:lipoprotein-anchoring transpeptidase ErfK/SrfK
MKRMVSRRDFLKVAGVGLGTLAFNPFRHEPVYIPKRLPQFPAGDYLGRIAVTPNFYSTELKSQPNSNVPAIRNVGQDEVIVWQRSVIGTDAFGGTSRTWVETPEGYIYAPHVQPVRNNVNTPLTKLPEGKPGFWAEVTVPYVDLQLQGQAISPSVQYTIQTNQPLRIYSGQVIWVDQIVVDPAGPVYYRLNESPGHGYGYGDLFLADGAGFKPLTDADIAPINPEVDPATKKIVIDATPGRQTLSCFEGDSEVFFCRISSGYGEQFSTPVGDQAVSWKTFSIHMAANTGSDSGYDTMAVPWPTFFNTNAGAAVHGVFWHNDFGVRRSHGCVNVLPEDAKWIFRWTAPFVSIDQGEVRLAWPNVGGSYSTAVSVNELKA